MLSPSTVTKCQHLLYFIDIMFSSVPKHNLKTWTMQWTLGTDGQILTSRKYWNDVPEELYLNVVQSKIHFNPRKSSFCFICERLKSVSKLYTLVLYDLWNKNGLITFHYQLPENSRTWGLLFSFNLSAPVSKQIKTLKWTNFF